MNTTTYTHERRSVFLTEKLQQSVHASYGEASIAGENTLMCHDLSKIYRLCRLNLERGV